MSEDVKTEAVQDQNESVQQDSSQDQPEKGLEEKLYPEQEEKQEEPKEEEKPEGDSGEKGEEKPEQEAKDDESKSDDKDWTLELPEGSPVKQDRLDKIVAHAREQGLSKDEAETLLDQEQEAVSAYIEAEKSAYAERSGTWVDEIKSDSELGGEKFSENVEHARRVMAKFSSEELKGMLEESGLGNHPEVVRLFARVGKAMASDTFEGGVKDSATHKPPKSMAERLYGNTNPN